MLIYIKAIIYTYRKVAQNKILKKKRKNVMKIITSLIISYV